ncbi:MAG: aminodeoxychorismate synthase component I, partial [Spirochaetota bacterium]|nr:aminodeoxychorismate synthase component I [Spirochaetota bacterium]
ITLTEKGTTTKISGSPFDELQKIISELSNSYRKIESENEVLKHFPVSAGLFGYLAYDLKDHIEDISRTTIDDLNLPDLYMISPGLVLVEDKVSEKIQAIVIEPESSDISETNRIFELVQDAERSRYALEDFTVSSEGFKSNFIRDEYEDSIYDVINYIKEGDIYQVNISQRFSIDFSGDTYSLFVELFRENPAPFFAYINCGDHQIVSTSPERFILQEESRIEARPIKGTRPRGNSPEEDEKLKKELQSSPKDDAELSMIVDLLRNDMGKVCRGGSVKVLEHKTMTAYKNVFHLVSTIEGELEEDKDSIDLIKAAFPGGSITGCPKIRSMEIIDEKEPFRRHLYTGSIGYIGFNSRMDLSIVIRTATITGGKLFLSVGGGIVYDSDPADEYDETLHKAQSLMKVLNRHKSNTHTQQNICWSNGKFIPEEEAAVSVLSKGYQYGKGVFETLKAVEGKIENLQEHIDRLKAGTISVLGEIPDDYNWQEIINLLLIKNKLTQNITAVKIIISEGETGLFGNMDITVTTRRYELRPSIKISNSLKIGIYPHRRESFLADYKTMNYLYYLK